MNEPNPLETQLRSWRPRRPAAGLKARLFAGTPRPHSIFGGAAFWWRLGPVMGCVLLALLVIQGNHPPAKLSGATKTNSLLATLAVSNQFAHFVAGADINRNLWQVATFESTKTSPSNSTMSSFRLLRTNSLMRD